MLKTEVSLSLFTSTSIAFSAFKNRERQAHDLLLLHDIEALEKQVSEETDGAKFEEVNTDLHNKINELGPL